MAQTALPGIKLFNLKGKCALITGGSKGLGLAMAAGLASAGADVALLNRNLEEGRTAADQLRKRLWGEGKGLCRQRHRPG